MSIISFLNLAPIQGRTTIREIRESDRLAPANAKSVFYILREECQLLGNYPEMQEEVVTARPLRHSLCDEDNFPRKN